jgi:hypothetical protein
MRLMAAWFRELYEAGQADGSEIYRKMTEFGYH